MRAKLAVFTALLSVAAFVRPASRQAAGCGSTKVAAGVVVPDQSQDAARSARHTNGQRSAPITIDVFPNLSTPGNDPQPGAPSRPGVAVPAQTIHAPAEHSPATPSQPKFSPRLQPPNGRTDGKVYPA